ncbi:MAG: hypothetical protein ACOC3V_05510 [bacterium]
MSNAQFYLEQSDPTYAIIPYGTFVNGGSYGIAVDLEYLGFYLGFGSEKIEKNVYAGDFMTFGLMVEPLPSLYLMAGLGSFEMHEHTQYFGYDFKLMYDVLPSTTNFVLAPMVEINSLQLSFGVGL